MKVQLIKSQLLPSSGYGECARSFLKVLSLSRSIEPIIFNDLEDLKTFNQYEESCKLYKDIPILSLTGQFHKYFHQHPCKIIRTMTEGTPIPVEWVDKLNSYSSIVVPGQFNYEAFLNGGVDTDLLKIVKEPVSIPTGFQKSYPFKTGKKFIILSVFSGRVWYRKGVDLLIKAYCETFGRDDDVCLVIKSSLNKEELLKIGGINFYDSLPEIELIDEHLSEDEMQNLYSSASLYAMVSRGEGIGRPYLYSMANGVPVLATGWGGNREFMNSENSLLVKYKLEKMGLDFNKIYLPKDQGLVFAKPDIDDIKAKLRYSYENQQDIKLLGTKGRRVVLNNHSYNSVLGGIEAVIFEARERPSGNRHKTGFMSAFYPLDTNLKREVEDLKSLNHIPEKVAVYGTGAAASMALHWIEGHGVPQKIVFVDREVSKNFFNGYPVNHFKGVDYSRFDLLLIAVDPIFLKDVVKNLESVTDTPLYYFGA